MPLVFYYLENKSLFGTRFLVPGGSFWGPWGSVWHPGGSFGRPGAPKEDPIGKRSPKSPKSDLMTFPPGHHNWRQFGGVSVLGGLSEPFFGELGVLNKFFGKKHPSAAVCLVMRSRGARVGANGRSFGGLWGHLGVISATRKSIENWPRKRSRESPWEAPGNHRRTGARALRTTKATPPRGPIRD